MQGHDCRQAGFTLIELLITITIVVLLTGTAISAYVTFNENRQLDIDARNLLTSVNKLRSKAVFLEYPADCTGLAGFRYESVLGVSGLLDSVYSYASCAEGTRGEETVKILDSSVFGSPFGISFLPSTGAITSGTEEQIEINSTTGSQRSKTVVVNQTMSTVNRVIDQ